MTIENEAIVVVSGLPRSGTSMMMQMLEAGGVPPLADFQRKADDDNPKGYYELEPVKQLKTHPEALDQAEGKAVKVIHMLLTDLPSGHRYKVLFMRRDISEVVASQRKMLSRTGKQGAALPDAALIKVFEGQLVKVDKWLAEQSHIQCMDVPHREVVTKPAEVAGLVNAFLGGGLDEPAMAAAVDPALYRNRVT